MITIRNAEPDDAASIAQLNSNEFGYVYPVSKTKLQLESILKKSSDRIFVVCIDDEIAGYVHACDYEGTYFDPQKNIMAIAVDGSHRGMGLGRMLLEAVEDWAKLDGCSGVRLVSGMNREGAHLFYEHCGYKLRKMQKNYIKLF
ncbi:MAG: GNAT family N-acetyltransferase [Clostridia bacterium]|nr:GNAT family N-acetyltransferase [Clostridia bacterium]